MPLCQTPSLSRRKLLGMSGSLVASAFIPRFARAADGRDPRFITIILRGAMDGLSAVPALGDPNYRAARTGLALPPPGSTGGALDLNGLFGLNPALAGLKARYDAILAKHPKLDRGNHANHLGTLGTGNHFIEVSWTSPRPFGSCCTVARVESAIEWGATSSMWPART